MPLETASYPKDLVTSNPASSDGMNNADDHMRMIKACLKNALAGVNAALTRAVASTFALQMPSGTPADPSYSFVDEPTLGLYRSAAAKLAFTGRLIGNGAVAVGSIHMFPIAPPGLGSEYLELNGATYANSSFPDLANFLGQGGSTFIVPDLYSTGRFPRSRSASVGAWVAQGNQNKSHYHNVAGTTGAADRSLDHLHTGSGTTGSMNRSNPHSHPMSAVQAVGGNLAGGGAFGLTQSTNTGATDINHEHPFSFTSNGMDRSIDHLHGFNVNSGGGSADGAEARPEAWTFVFCIKT